MIQLMREKSWYIVQDVCEELNKSDSAVRKLLNKGLLKGHKSRDGRWVILRNDLVDFINPR
jgi:predicted transcriptional regulator